MLTHCVLLALLWCSERAPGNLQPLAGICLCSPTAASHQRMPSSTQSCMRPAAVPPAVLPAVLLPPKRVPPAMHRRLDRKTKLPTWWWREGDSRALLLGCHELGWVPRRGGKQTEIINHILTDER